MRINTKRRAVLALAIAGSLCAVPLVDGEVATIPNLRTSDVERTHAAHPDIEGMTYCFGSTSAMLVQQNKSGYFYYELDYYYTPFTAESNLYLIHVKTEFTSGYIATQNGEKGFSDMFDLYKGYVHMSVSQREDGNKKSSTLNYVTAWPSSSTFTKSYSSTTGLEISLGSDDGIEAGDKVKIEVGTSTSIKITCSDTVTIYGDEPSLSAQTSASNSYERQWNYEYSGLGRVTYTLDTYYMFEAVGDGTGYQDYSFDLNLDIQMKNVKYKGYLWQSTSTTESDTVVPFGMYE